MSGDAIVFLHTPLVQVESKVNGAVLRLKGKLVDQEDQGVTIQIKAVGNDKGWFDNVLTGKKIFVPMHKLDYILLD